MVSALMTLTNGKSDSMPTVAASAVFPVPGGPSSRQLIRGVCSLVRTCRGQEQASPHYATSLLHGRRAACLLHVALSALL